MLIEPVKNVPNAVILVNLIASSIVGPWKPEANSLTRGLANTRTEATVTSAKRSKAFRRLLVKASAVCLSRSLRTLLYMGTKPVAMEAPTRAKIILGTV